MKNLLSNRVWKAASCRGFGLGSSTRENISNTCLFCKRLAKSGNPLSSVQVSNSSPYQNTRFYSADSHSNDYLDSLESEIQTWARTHSHNLKSSSPQRSSLHQSNESKPSPTRDGSVNLNPQYPEGLKHPAQNAEEEGENKLEDELDLIAEEKRREFFSNPDQMPDLPDIAALKPPRLKRYIPGTPRIWYVDKFTTISKRLMRAFTKPQLENICRVLGFDQSEEVGLSPCGITHLKTLRIKNPKSSVKDLRAMVLAEANPLFEMKVKKRDPSDTSYTKADLVNFVLTEHWGLTDPKSIPLPADFETLTHRFQTNSEVFEVPYHEMFLLHLEQVRSPKRNLIGYLSQKNNVNVEFSQKPTGMIIRGQMKDRDHFWRSFEKMRRPICKRTLRIPPSLGKVAVTPKLLTKMSELAGCYLELDSDCKHTIVAYCYDADLLKEKVPDVFDQLALLSFQDEQNIVAISTSGGPLANQHSRDMGLLPFLPLSEPTWFMESVADTYGRLTYPVSRKSSNKPPEVEAIHEEVCPVNFDYVQCLSGHMLSPQAWLQDAVDGTDMTSVELRVTFGHQLFPRQGSAPLMAAKFSADASQLHRLQCWASNVIPRPFFLPGPHPLTRGASAFPLSEAGGSNSSMFPTDPLLARSSTADNLVEIFQRPLEPEALLPSGQEWTKNFRVTTLPEGTSYIEEVDSKYVTVLMPDQSMDILFTVERRTLPVILEGHQRGLTHLVHQNERLILTASYVSEIVYLSMQRYVEAGRDLRFRNERRVDSRWPNGPYTELRSELLMRYEPSKLTDFVHTSTRLASVCYASDTLRHNRLSAIDEPRI